MKVELFDIEKGLYAFEINEIDSEFHAHPAFEIISADQGDFSVITKDNTFNKLKLAAIPPNIKHKVKADNCVLKVNMLEHRTPQIVVALDGLSLESKDGIFYNSLQHKDSQLLDKLWESITNIEAPFYDDVRLDQCLNLLNEE